MTPRVEIYLGYLVEFFESAPGEWRSKVVRLNESGTAPIISSAVYSLDLLRKETRRGIETGQFGPVPS